MVSVRTDLPMVAERIHHLAMAILGRDREVIAVSFAEVRKDFDSFFADFVDVAGSVVAA